MPHLNQASTPCTRHEDSDLDGRSVETDPRTRFNFAYRSGKRGNFKTDGMDPRPLIHGLAMGPGCAEQHPNKAEEGPKWKLQRSVWTWQRMCSRCEVRIAAGEC